VINSDSNRPRNKIRQEQKGNAREYSRLQQYFINTKIDGVQSQSALKLLPARWANKNAAKEALTKVKHASTTNVTKRPKHTQTQLNDQNAPKRTSKRTPKRT
jgi:hypothetical protein